MIKITLPDKSVHHFNSGVSLRTIAQYCGVEKTVIAAIVNDEEYDVDRSIEVDSRVFFIFKNSTEGLHILRHDCAHILAQAVQELFDDVQIAFGPATDDGFYYDFFSSVAFSEHDLPRIEKKMIEIVHRNEKIIREIWSRDQLISILQQKNETLKLEWLNELDEKEILTVYRQGNWMDLCRGPHMPSTGYVGKAFKLLKISGCYWRGDNKKQKLQRIYGTAFWSIKDLKCHLKRIEEAKKRDHRIIGKTLSLFHLQEESVGSVFWHPKGAVLFFLLQNYMRKKLLSNGYEEVKTPQLVDCSLWKKSGHWDKFREHMFTIFIDGDTCPQETLALKPMNCPCHVQIFKNSIVSYRQLPWRISEFGSCHRYEPHGALHGIMRVRAFTQDDAHIFCTPDQIVSETVRFCNLLQEVYSDFGFRNVKVKFSDRPSVRSGEDSMWDLAEQSLKEAVSFAKIPYTVNSGEGAFYGPKLEFILIDAIGRDWQCGTLQVDFIMPQRLEAFYIGVDNKRHIPVMIHRALFGSFERFIGILIEEYEGYFPLWLAPVQVVVSSISEGANIYAQEIYNTCLSQEIRCTLDIRSEKINYKIREHSLQKIPFLFIVGEQEMKNRTVSIRQFRKKGNIVLSVEESIAYIKDIESKRFSG